MHTVKQPKLAKQPRNIVVIVGESFGDWPFLPKYKNLGLVDNMLALQNSVDAAHVATMLPHGSGTIFAVNGLVSGIPDMGLYENYQENSFNGKYATGIGYIMKQLGYKTVFGMVVFPDGKISANLLKRKALMNSIVQMSSVIIAVMLGAVRMLLCLSKLKLI